MKLYLKITLSILIISLLAMCAFAIGISAGEPDTSVAEAGSYTAPQGSWAPAENSGVTYAVWYSESDFLKGEEPLAAYTTTELLGSNINISGVTYVHLFSDLKNTGKSKIDEKSNPEMDKDAIDAYNKEVDAYNTDRKILPPANCTYRINLGGKTLTTNLDLQVQFDFKTNFTIANGTFITSHQIKCSNNNTIIFENVHLIDKTDTFGYGLCCNLVRYKDCKIELTISGTYIFLASADNSIERSRLEFINTDIITSGKGSISKDYGLFRFIEQANADTKWDIYFDKDSSIQATVSTYASLNESEGLDSDGVSPQYFKKTQRIMFEEGFLFSSYSVPDFQYKHVPVDREAIELLPAVIKPADDDICKIMIVKAGTEEGIAGELYATANESGMYSISQNKPTENVAWYYTPKGSRVVTCVAAKYVDGIDTPVITVTDWRNFKADSTITLAGDLTVYFAPNSPKVNVNDYQNNLTFDLNGNTLFSSYRITISGIYNKTYTVNNITFKNGKIVAHNVKADGTETEEGSGIYTYNNSSLFYGWPTADGNLVLDNVELKQTGDANVPLISTYNGNFIIRNSKLDLQYYLSSNMTHKGVLQNEPTTSYAFNILVENSTVKCGTSVFSYSLSIFSDKSYIHIKNSTVEAANNLFYFNNADVAPEADDALDIKVENSYIKAKTFASGKENVIAAQKIVLSNTYLSCEPADFKTGSTVSKVAFSEGEILMPTNSDKFPYYVGKVDARMYANLTLKSDIRVNFYLPILNELKNGDVVGIIYNGTTYRIDDGSITETVDNPSCYVIHLECVTPNTALEEISYSLIFYKDGFEHTAEVSYSVIDYLSSVINSDLTVYAKRMTVAAAEYISAAYAHEGKTSAELEALKASEAYKSHLPEVIEPSDSENEIGALSAAVSGAQLDLGSTNRLRFNLNESYTGTLTIGEITREVTNGKVGELTYVELDVSAADLYDTVFTITATGIDGTGTYSLNDYALSVKNSEIYTEAQKNLVMWFYSYCAYASQFNELYK